jgi:hypothetical protein
LALIAAIDDATGQVPFALFREEEDAASYFELMRAISQSHGLPQAVYADRHSIFQSPKKATVEQRLARAAARDIEGQAKQQTMLPSLALLSPTRSIAGTVPDAG